MKIQFSFKVRQAMQVACVVAEEIANNPALGGLPSATAKNGIRPVLLSISGTTFRFEGGTVVRVHLVGGREDGTEGYGVTRVDIRYRPHQEYAVSLSDEKVSETWGADKLLVLKEARWWWHPHVVPASDASVM